MTFRDLEKSVWAEAKKVFNNPKLRLKDILEWSTSEEAIKGNTGVDEVVAVMPELGVYVCVAKSNDKRL